MPAQLAQATSTLGRWWEGLLIIAQGEGAAGDLPPDVSAGGDGSPLLSLPEVLILAAVVLLATIVLMNVRRRAARRDDDEQLTPHERVERIKQVHGMRNDLRQMMVELEELTRRFSAQLDAKSARMERLIEEADGRIAELRRLRGEVGEGDSGGASFAKRAGREDERAQDEGGGESGSDPPDPLTVKVYELADAGTSPAEIARKLNEHIGKVELILALRQA